MLQQFAIDQLLWTGRLVLVAVVLIGIKRAASPLNPDPHVNVRIELWMDLLLALMVCSWGTWFILMCNPWNSLSAYIEAGRLMAQHGLRSDDPVAFVRAEYQQGTSLGHFAVMVLALPIYVALKKRQVAHLRASV